VCGILFEIKVNKKTVRNVGIINNCIEEQ